MNFRYDQKSVEVLQMDRSNCIRRIYVYGFRSKWSWICFQSNRCKFDNGTLYNRLTGSGQIQYARQAERRCDQRMVDDHCCRRSGNQDERTALSKADSENEGSIEDHGFDIEDVHIPNINIDGQTQN